MFFKKPKQDESKIIHPRQSIFSTDAGPGRKSGESLSALVASHFQVPKSIDGSMDSSTGTVPMFKSLFVGGNIPDAQLTWYASQTFISYQACAIMSQHWLVDKACSMPAEDALRVGYEIKLPEEIQDPDKIIKAIKKCDKRRQIIEEALEFIRMARVFGIRVAIFKVNSTDPEYYEKPFNINGVKPGSYVGISQVDQIHVAPQLTDAAVTDPGSIEYYDPQYFLIGGKRYHKSHCVVYIPYPVPDMLKPRYYYGGVSVPQRIYERVYAAERTANEAPILAMTKRTFVFKTDAVKFFSNLAGGISRLAEWIGVRDNQGALVVDKEGEDLTQTDTSLADLDAVIMNQYQLVAASANVPATKLLGTTPKGFNATGEGEAEDYRIFLESIQTHGATHLINRHHELVMKSEIAPQLGIDPAEVEIDWMPLDSPTAAEWAAINLQKAQTAQVYAATGAIDGMDIRDQLKNDKTSDYSGLAEIEEAEVDPTPEEPNGNPQATASI